MACVAKQIKTYATHGQGKGVENSIQTGSRETLFNYDGYRLLGEYDISGNHVQETVWLGNLPVATIQNGNTYYLHTDHLGTPRVITDSDNMEVWIWESDPFGTAAADEDPDGGGVHFSYNLRFPGQYYDAETGLHYNYYRDYDSATGRYIESDPIGLWGGLNTYTYVLNNPIQFVDPLGLAPGDEYASPHSAGRNALIDILPRSISEGVEYGGYVYENPNGSYSYTLPVTDGLPDSVSINKGMCPSDTSPYASYHTHGAPDPYAGLGRGGPEHFSGKDIRMDNKEGVHGYLGTPTSEMLFHGKGSSYEIGIGNLSDY